MGTETPIRLIVPRQDLEALTLFRANPEAAQKWAGQLPVANPRGSAQQLQEALDEINRCRLKPELRFNILNTLQRNLGISSDSLSRRFLNQPLVMPEEPRQMASLTDTLYSQAITAYTCVAIEGLNQRDSIRGVNPARLVCEAILRALEFCGKKLLLNFQLHKPVEANGWLTMHQLYALAERQELAGITLQGCDGGDTSIATTYLAAMMLGCCKPNQLRQSDLALTYKALLSWCHKLKLEAPGPDSGLFLIDLDRDQPPLYSALYRNQGGPQCRQIDTSALIAYLEQIQSSDDDKGRSGVTLNDGTQLSSGLFSHYIDSLGTMSVRNFTRKVSDDPLAVSIGLGNAHYHAAGDRSFSRLLYGDQYKADLSPHPEGNPFLESKGSSGDMWSQANPEEDFVREQSASEPEARLNHQVELDAKTEQAINHDGPEVPEEEAHPVHQMRMVNASPGGYCLEWNGSLSADVKSGEIVSVQEEPNGNWVIAIIRWVSQLENSRSLLGLELMSPRAMAYGAVTRQKTGEESVPQKVLLLPEIQLVGQPHTLITPRAGFREKQKITLFRKGEKLTVQLQRQVAASGSFSQFDFRYIQLLGDVVAEDKSGPLDAAYDSIWSNI